MKNFNIRKINFTSYFLLSVLFWSSMISFSQDFSIKSDLNYGKFTVGLKVINQYDLSRTYNPSNDEFGNPITGEGFRPIQTLIWFPAQIDKNSINMLYGDYVYNFTNIENFILNTKEIKNKVKSKIMKNLRVSEDVFLNAMAYKTETYKDANPIEGSFPVIIYAPSWSNLAWENLTLCSFLASYGYIVVASPSFNKNSREMTDDVESLDTQAKDQEFLVNFMKDFPNANSFKFGSLGYSWGATSNVIAAERQKKFDAIICLDGALEHWYTQYKNGTPYLDPLKMKIPFCAMSLAPPSDEVRQSRKMDSSFIFFESLKYSEAYRIMFLNMMHHFFRGSSQIFEKYNTENEQDVLKERTFCYNIMCQYALNFFNAYLKNDKRSKKWLKSNPEYHNVPKEILSVVYKAAVKQ